MGFALSVLYILICYLTPVALFGSLAQFRIEMFLAILILFISLPKMMRSFVLKAPQALALLGLAVAVFLSVLIGVNWPSGAITSVIEFIPAIYAFFLVCLHCNSRKKLNVLVLVVFVVCLFVIIQGNLELIHTPAQTGGQGAYDTTPQESEILPGDIPDTVTLNARVWDIEHPYLIAQQVAPWQWIYRVRGLGEINDPNDFGQLLVCEIPLLFLFWRRKRTVRNLAFVIVPSCVLIYGVYLTHSRGALVALTAVIIVAARRRIGTVPAVVVAGALMAGAMALHFTGGRAISAETGSDRTDLWGGSLQLLKTHPLFGVGIGHLPEYLGHTAHNTVLVCAAELGLFGLFFWVLFLLPTARDVFMIAMPKRVRDTAQTGADGAQSSLLAWRGPALEKADINHMGHCLLLSLTGFLVAGWFLSRAYAMTFFFLGGMVEAVYEEALRQGMVAPRLLFTRTLIYSFALTILLLLIVYVMLRIVNISH